MKNQRFLPVACALSVCAFVSASHADLITATHPIPADPSMVFNTGAGMATDGPFVFDNRIGQSFTALEAGQLSWISFVASRLSGTNVDLRLSVMTFEGGQPSTLLGTTLIDLTSFHEGFLPGFPEAFTHSIDFSDAGILIEEGLMYALIFQTDTTEANYRMYGDYEGYAGGDRLFSQNGEPYEQQSGDLYFEVQVVPALGTIPVMMLGLASARRRRRRG